MYETMLVPLSVIRDLKLNEVFTYAGAFRAPL
jgi:hypothetical protein